MKLAQFRRLGLAFILFTVLEAVATGQPVATALDYPASARSAPESARLALLSSTSTSLSMVWTAPELQIGSDAQGFLEIQALGLDQASQPGELRLPLDSYLLALPAAAEAHLQIVSSQVDRQPLFAPVALNPQPQGVLINEQGRPVGGAWAPAEVAGASATQTRVVDPLRLEEAGILRGVRLARLVFYPALPEAGSLRLVRRLQINLTWNIPVIVNSAHSDLIIASGTTQSPPSQDLLLTTLKDQVINPWMVVADADQPQAANSPAAQQPGVYLEIDHAGLYRITSQDLQPYGLTNSNPANLRLFRGTQEVAYSWDGNGDSVFDPGESLLFYADRRFSRWTELDAYRLVYDPAVSGSRMASRSAAPGSLAAGAPMVKSLSEENLVYTPDCFCQALPGRDGDHWVWQKLAQPDQNQVDLSFVTPSVNEKLTAELTLWMISFTERFGIYPDHQVKVALNGNELDVLDWDGKQAVTKTLTIPAGKLLNGYNTLTLSLPMNIQGYYDQFWLDAFQISYYRTAALVGQEISFQAESSVAKAYMLGLSASSPYLALDITDPQHPVQLTDFVANGNQVSLAGNPGGQYWLSSIAAIAAPKRIRSAADPWQYQPGGAPAGADYLIITHPSFASSLQPLVDLRKSQGYTVAVANVLGIYDTWGDGRPDPQAIRAFLSEAYSIWLPRPAFVLLVGDGTYDPRQYLTSQPTFIPPYLANVDPWAGETAADNRFVAVSGADNIPDMLLGRLPVQTLAQAQAVVAKIVYYESDAPPSPWNANVLMVSDDRDWAGDFYGLNLTGRGLVASPFQPLTLACPDQGNEPPYMDNCPASIAQQIHTSLLNLWPTGPFLVQYTGHSSWQQWAAERYFHLDDLPVLQNARQPTVVLEMTCFTGAFQRPEPTLDESLVQLPGNGAIAAWGSTGLGVSTGHDSLSQGFFQAVFKDNAQTLGEAAMAGKLLLNTTGFNLDLLDTFNILGDPALHFNRQVVPWANQVFLPQISR